MGTHLRPASQLSHWNRSGIVLRLPAHLLGECCAICTSCAFKLFKSIGSLEVVVPLKQLSSFGTQKDTPVISNVTPSDPIN